MLTSSQISRFPENVSSRAEFKSCEGKPLFQCGAAAASVAEGHQRVLEVATSPELRACWHVGRTQDEVQRSLNPTTPLPMHPIFWAWEL